MIITTLSSIDRHTPLFVRLMDNCVSTSVRHANFSPKFRTRIEVRQGRSPSSVVWPGLAVDTFNFTLIALKFISICKRKLHTWAPHCTGLITSDTIIVFSYSCFCLLYPLRRGYFQAYSTSDFLSCNGMFFYAQRSCYNRMFIALLQVLCVWDNRRQPNLFSAISGGVSSLWRIHAPLCRCYLKS